MPATKAMMAANATKRGGILIHIMLTMMIKGTIPVIHDKGYPQIVGIA
jgi:hypothetical protein